MEGRVNDREIKIGDVILDGRKKRGKIYEKKVERRGKGRIRRSQGGKGRGGKQEKRRWK